MVERNNVEMLGLKVLHEVEYDYVKARFILFFPSLGLLGR